MEWISVEDELPDDSDHVLIYLPNTIEIGYIFYGHWYIYRNAGKNDPFRGGAVTHWMPLPELPEQ